jgi:hypothetical protein
MERIPALCERLRFFGPVHRESFWKRSPGSGNVLEPREAAVPPEIA